jgi:methylated-DNA-[protein]-cysteine S-methyltransferase
MTELQIDRAESPIGTLTFVTRDGVLCALDFTDCEARLLERLRRRFGPDASPRPARDPGGHGARLRDYLAGDLDALVHASVDSGGTPFQEQVWRALRTVPSGTTRSYSEIATAIGRPGAARAVGTANGRNPVALVIPCHRVVSADRSLGGYAGGLERKRWLLRHEGVDLVSV